MFCSNCGTQLADGSVICPNCKSKVLANVERADTAQKVEEIPAKENQSAQQFDTAPINVSEQSYTSGYNGNTQSGAPTSVKTPPVYVSAPESRFGKKKAEVNKKSKGFAAIASALIVFPAILCLLIDYLGAPEFIQKWFPDLVPEFLQTGNMFWSAYMIGFFMCVWMIVVLPILRPKRPAVTVCICLSVVSVYMLLLSYINDNVSWYDKFVLPISLMVIISSAIMTVLISYKIIKDGHVVTAIGAQIAMLIIATEALFDLNFKSQISLRGSLIMAVVIVGALLLYEAVYYTARLNKK